MPEIRIKTGRPYSVLIGRGLLRKAGELIESLGGARKIAVVTDKNVAKLYLETVSDSLTAAGFHVSAYTIKPGEESKSMEELSKLLESLAAWEFGRGDMIAALGGGVVGDLAGFAASVYQRGIEYVHISGSTSGN